jgi:hypothetical protein
MMPGSGEKYDCHLACAWLLKNASVNYIHIFLKNLHQGYYQTFLNLLFQFVAEFSSDDYLDFLSSYPKQGLNAKILKKNSPESSEDILTNSLKSGSRQSSKKKGKVESKVENSITPTQMRDKVSAMVSSTVLDILFEHVIIETHPKLAKDKFDLGNEIFVGERRALKKVLELVEQTNKSEVSDLVEDDKSQKVTDIDGIVRWRFNYHNYKELREYNFFFVYFFLESIKK